MDMSMADRLVRDAKSAVLGELLDLMIEGLPEGGDEDTEKAKTDLLILKAQKDASGCLNKIARWGALRDGAALEEKKNALAILQSVGATLKMYVEANL